MSNGDLSNYVDINKEKVDNLFAFTSINRIFQGINHLHSYSIIHRDLKPSNILVDHDCNVFISDFDLVHVIDENKNEMTGDIGSSIYSAPEQFNGEKLSFSTDIYSFGLLIYFLFEKKHLKNMNNYESYFDKNHPKNITETISSAPKQIQNIFQNCVKFNPNERMTEDDIFKSLYKLMNSFEFLDYFIINEKEQKRMIPTIVQYFIDNINFLYQRKKDLKIKIHTYYIFLFLDVFLQANNSSSIIKLGKLYASGKSFDKDYEKAKKYFQIAIQKNDSFGFVEIGQLYANGIGVQNNLVEAFKFYELAAKQNNWKGYYLMGECFYNGKGVPKDIKKGHYLFELALKSKNPEAFFEVGSFYFKGNKNNDYSKAKYYFELAANLNYAEAQLMLGIIYSEGKGVKVNIRKAIEYFELSIKNNCFSAYVNLGNIYYNGKGANRDYYKVKNYIEKAAQRYVVSAFVYLSNYYLNDLEINIDVEKVKEYLKLATHQDDCLAYRLCGDFYYKNKKYSKSLKYYKVSADVMNDPTSQSFLGVLYSQGKVINKDINKAKDYFERAANNGYSAANVYLGELYFNGNGFKQDFTKAKKYFEIAASQNNALAYIYLGHYFYEGILTKIDYSKALEYYKLAAEQNNSYGYLNLSKMYYKGEGVAINNDKAIEYIKKAAENGNWIALQNLAILNFDGTYLPKNIKNGYECLELSVKTNDPDALLSLGILYYEAESLENDYEKAKECFELSAKLGNSYAFLNLAKIYIDGKYEKKDHYKAIEYFEKAAKMNNSYAFVCLGDFYSEGKGVEQNYKKAIEHYQKAAEQFNSEALLNLGLLYYQGNGVKQNYQKAKEYFELSASRYNIQALYKLGKLYYEGKVIEKNYKKALEYFLLSAEKYNLDSNYYAGNIFESGKGVKIDISKAIQYYTNCQKIHGFKKIFVMKDINLFNYKDPIESNYYRSMNDLGLIYLTELDFQNIKLAENCLKVAGVVDGYPLGQNSLGLFLQLYSKRINYAKRFFEKASEQKLAFAEFNLAFLSEKEGKYNEMINHFIRASDYENEPFRFKDQIIDDDERLDISKSFIVLFSNLKLVKHYLSQEKSKNNFSNCENYLFRAIFQPLFRLLFQKNNKSYSFHFKYDTKTNKLTNLKDFFFNCPIFNCCCQRESNWNEIEINSDYFDKSLILSIDMNEEDKEKEVKIKNNSKQKEKNVKNGTKINSSLNEKIESILNKMNSDERFEIIPNNNINLNVNKIQFNFKNVKLRCLLEFPSQLLVKICENLNDANQLINEVIQDGMKILYEPPFNILFGRIKIPKTTKDICNEINKKFYDGFDCNDN